jgi:hypothetical protein
VKRIDAVFDIEREINGLPIKDRLARRRQESRSCVDALEAWMRAERTKLSRSSPVADPIDYMLKRWSGSRGCLPVPTAVRIGQRSWQP